jgi:aminopeptidase N
MFLLLLALLFQDPSPSPVWVGYPAQDAVRYEVTLTADFEARTLAGSARIQIRTLEPAEALTLDLRSGESWKMKFTDAAGAPLAAVFAQHQVRVPLARRTTAGEMVEIVAHFSGVPVDGLEFSKSRYGEWFLVADPFGTRTRGWLPCEDFVGDRASWKLDLTVPADMEAIGAGAWTEVTSNDPQVRRFVGETKADMPPTLFAFAAGPWQRVEEDGDARLTPHFVYAEDEANARLGLGHHAEWMQIMEKTFGPYLWEKFTTAQVPTRWGGVEYPGNVWLMEGLYDGGDHGIGTLAHEFVHMWFGDAVGYATWEHAWLSEGFASYFGPWLHEQSGGLELASVMSGSRRAWLRGSQARQHPVVWKDYPFPDDLFMSSSSNTYQKGSWVLHMLRNEVGDAAFFGGIAAYYQAHRGSAVTSDSLRSAMEKAAGRELGWFFTQWLDRPNCPVLKVTPTPEGVSIEQVQTGSPFRFPLTLQWKDADGAKQIQTVLCEGATTPVNLAAGWKDLLLDPDVHLLFEQRK